MCKILGYFSTRKGQIYSSEEFRKRYVVVDYNLTEMYLINLNSRNKLFRKIKKLKYRDIPKSGLRLEK